MSEVKKMPLGDLCTIEKGKTGIKKAVPGPYPLVTTAEERGSHNEYHFDKPSVIIPVVSSSGHGHASLKRIHYQEGKFAVGNILCVITPKDAQILNANFLYHYLDLNKEELLVSLMRGMANVTLPIKELAKLEVPLMPIEKQIKWVELFEKTSADTGNLSAELSHQQNLLSKLRQSILQDAIQGKLTEQWRKDNPKVEPASELLKKIKEEKKKLVKEGKIKKQKALPPISPEEIPFEIPKYWKWCRLGDVVNSYQNGLAKRYSSVGHPYIVLRLADIENGKISLRDNRTILLSDTEIKKYALREGDILVTRVNGSIEIVGNFTPASKLDQPIAYCDHFIRVRLNSIYMPFINLIGRCIHVRQMIENEFKTTSGQKTINQSHLNKILLPLPSETEHKIISTKVEKLFAYCDELEKQISKSQRESDQLMQSVLKEAFGKQS